MFKKIDSLGAAACIMALLQNIPSPLSAEGNKKNEASQKENPNYAIVDEPWKTDQNFPGRNRKIAVFTNAPYPANGITHLYNFGEFLYWSSGYDLDYAVVGTDPSTLQRTLYTFDKNFQPGLRLGMGYEFFPQGWDIRADWVCFHNKIEKTLRSGSTSIFNTWFSKYNDLESIPANTVTQQTSSWNLSLNQLNITMGNGICFSKYFTFRPNIGFRYIKLNDRFSIKYDYIGTSLFNKSSIKNHMNAYGLMLGLDNKFSLGAGIFLAGDFSTGLAYSIYSMDSLQLPSQRVNGFFGLNTDSSSHEMIPIIDARMDVGWERSFYDNQIGVRLNIGYEYHVLINGFSAIANPDIGNGTGFLYQKTNLFLQGLTLGAKMSY